MARIYRPTFTIPIPTDAELFERGGERFARFCRKGKSVTAPVTKHGPHAGRRVTVEAACWAIEYTDADGHMRRVKAFTDKRASEARAAELGRLVDRQRAGILDQQSIDLSRELSAGIGGHIDAYRVHLTAAGVSRWHLAESTRRVRSVIEACGFARLVELKAEPVQRWLNTRAAEGMGARTRNTYAASLRAFVRWCIADGRMATDPLGTLTKADEAADVRRERRALTEAELLALLRVAELRPLAELGRMSVKRPKAVDGKRAAGADAKPGPLALEPLTLADIDTAAARVTEKLRLKPARLARLVKLGRERGLIYRTLVLTGLRRGELAGLTWADLALDDPQAWLTVRANVAKNRKAETLPIRADLAAALRAWRTECGKPDGSATVFRVPNQLVLIMDRDLVAAGIARRVKAKDRNGRDCWRIDKRDADGRTIDVHALRHTTATYLARAGVAPRTAQSIMRHSDIRLTLGTYTDPRLLDTAAALDALPSMNPTPQRERIRATGTGNAMAADPAANALGGALGGKTRQANQNRASGFKADSAPAVTGDAANLHGNRELATACNGVQESGRPGSNRQHSAWKANLGLHRLALKAFTPSILAFSPVFANRRVLTRFDAICGSSTTLTPAANVPRRKSCSSAKLLNESPRRSVPHAQSTASLHRWKSFAFGFARRVS